MCGCRMSPHDGRRPAIGLPFGRISAVHDLSDGRETRPRPKSYDAAIPPISTGIRIASATTVFFDYDYWRTLAKQIWTLPALTV